MDQLVDGLAYAWQWVGLHQVLTALAHAQGHIAQRLADHTADRRVKVADFEVIGRVIGLEVQAERLATDHDVSCQGHVTGIQ